MYRFGSNEVIHAGVILRTALNGGDAINIPMQVVPCLGELMFADELPELGIPIIPLSNPRRKFGNASMDGGTRNREGS